MNDENRSNDMHGAWTDAAAQHTTHHLHSASGVAASAAASLPLKQIVTIRLDVDTLAWFKSGGPGYQTRINQLLREHMEAQQALARNAA